jgi:hypothetical protein
MNSYNVIGIQELLEKYHLAFIPEAHNFLLISNKVFDATWDEMPDRKPTDDILVSKPVKVTWNLKHKDDFHKEYIYQHSEMWKYSPEELWKIRCEVIDSLTL